MNVEENAFVERPKYYLIRQLNRVSAAISHNQIRVTLNFKVILSNLK